MAIGPKINYTKRNFTTRDNLGINSSGTSYQAELCPVINTVTPRAFYWMFAIWNYYDYLQNTAPAQRSVSDFEKNFLKRNDYYFVLSNLMVSNSDRNNLVGIANCSEDLQINQNGPYSFNRKYFLSSYGGMQYYVPGCFTLGLITERDTNENVLSFPKITERSGKPLALAFENVIKNTEYYRNYRLSDTWVPKAVLEELGQTISLSLKGMDECKQLLREAFFKPTRNILFNNEKLIQSKDYLLFLNRNYSVKHESAAKMRRILYDYFNPGGEHEADLPEDLKEIAVAWEVAIGRQYFTLPLELIWKYMLLELTAPMDINTWINACLRDSIWSFDISKPLESIIHNVNIGYDEREKRLTTGYRSSKDVSMNLENALIVMLSVCNRLSNRSDITQEQLDIGSPISVAALASTINDYKNRPIIDLVAFLMDEWILKRHEEVAFRKMTEGRDGFFIEKVDGRYYKKCNMDPDFTGNRMLQLLSVMRDLDMLV